MGEPIIFVGLDVHKGTISVALAEEGQRGEVREYGRIANTPADLKKLVDKLGRTGRTLRFCYEAGPCGYGIQRQLTAAGYGCGGGSLPDPAQARRAHQDRPSRCQQSG